MQPSQLFYLANATEESIYKYMGFLIDNNVYDDFLDFYFRT